MKLKIYLSVLLISLAIPLMSHAKCLNYVASQKPYSEIFNNFDISPQYRDGVCDVQKYMLLLVNIYAIKDGIIYVIYTDRENEYPINKVRDVYSKIFPGKEIIIGDALSAYQTYYAEFIATHYRKYLNNFVGLAGFNVFKRYSEPRKIRVKDREFSVVRLELNCDNVKCNELQDELQKDIKTFLSNIPVLTEINSKVKLENENSSNELDLKIKEFRNIASNDLVSQALNYAGGVPEDSSGFFFYYPVKKQEGQCVYGKITDARSLSGPNLVMMQMFGGVGKGQVKSQFVDLTKGDLNNVTIYEVRGVNPRGHMEPGPYLRFQSKIDGVNESFECDSKTCNIERLRRAWKLVASNCKSAKRAF